MGIATFESEIEMAEYERWLDEIQVEEEPENLDEAWCQAQIEISLDLQKYLTKTELLSERAN